MQLQTFGLILFLVVLGEFIQTRDAYKSIRPYKYHRLRGHKPRWPNFRHPSRYRHLKKRPPKAHYHPLNSFWNRPHYTPDHNKDDQSYTIEIELPKQLSHSQTNHRYHRNWLNEDDHDFYVDSGDEKLEERVLHTDKKKVRIKVIKNIEPKLRIKISRADFPVDSEVTTSTIGKLNSQKKLLLKN